MTLSDDEVANLITFSHLALGWLALGLCAGRCAAQWLALLTIAGLLIALVMSAALDVRGSTDHAREAVQWGMHGLLILAIAAILHAIVVVARVPFALLLSVLVWWGVQLLFLVHINFGCQWICGEYAHGAIDSLIFFAIFALGALRHWYSTRERAAAREPAPHASSS